MRCSEPGHRSTVAIHVMKHIVSHIGVFTAILLMAGCAHTKPITVSIASDGALTVAGRPCSESQLVTRLSELGSRNHHGVVIHADKNAPFKQVVTVTDAGKAAGVRPVTAFAK
jgi:biopolymer transport protein ExbD